MKKAILVSSAALMLSTVMPWYDLRNSFGIGEVYLGIQGPLFVIGALLLAFGAVSFLNIFLSLMGTHFFNLKHKGGTAALFLGAQALAFLVVANVIFYNPDFGTSAGSKTTRFGMIAAFVSIGVMMVSGWMVRRNEGDDENDVEDIFTEATPVETPVHTVSSYQAPTPTPAPTPAPSYQAPSAPAYGQSRPAAVDPLTLDARTRYKMMQSQGRYSSSAQNNLWGGGRGSAFSRPNPVEDQNQD